MARGRGRAREEQALESATAAFETCCDGFHYVMPRVQHSLSRALVQTNGDAARARLLATQAEAGFARLAKLRAAIK